MHLMNFVALILFLAVFNSNHRSISALVAPWEECDDLAANQLCFGLRNKQPSIDFPRDENSCLYFKNCDLMVLLKLLPQSSEASMEVYDFIDRLDSHPSALTDSRVTIYFSKTRLGPQHQDTDHPTETLALQVKRRLTADLDGTDIRTCSSVYQLTGESKPKKVTAGTPNVWGEPCTSEFNAKDTVTNRTLHYYNAKVTGDMMNYMNSSYIFKENTCVHAVQRAIRFTEDASAAPLVQITETAIRNRASSTVKYNLATGQNTTEVCSHSAPATTVRPRTTTTAIPWPVASKSRDTVQIFIIILLVLVIVAVLLALTYLIVRNKGMKAADGENAENQDDATAAPIPADEDQQPEVGRERSDLVI